MMGWCALQHPCRYENPALHPVIFLALARATCGWCIAMRTALLRPRVLPWMHALDSGQGYLWLAHRDVHSPLFTMAAQSRELWSELLAPAVPQLTADALEWQVWEPG